MGKLDGKTALVTGASSGIGRATALRFAAEGADLALVGRDETTLAPVADACREAGATVTVVTADLDRETDRVRTVREAVEERGGLDVLVNAAGIIASGTVLDTSLEDWRRMMSINVDAVFHLMQLALPSLQERRGAVVNVSSVTGTRSFPGVLAYCTSKAAVDHLTRCAALEMAPSGVRVNAVNPGVVVTQLHRRSGMDEEAYAAFLERGKQTHPLGRVGEPDEIADAILFLASSDSGWITGETLAVDGGRHLTCAR